MKRLLPEQAIKLVFDYAVTLAHGRFQLPPVENLDMAADVADRSQILEPTGSNGHAFARHTQHIGNQSLRHDQLVRLHTIMA